MKFRKCMAVLLAAMLLLGAMPVWAAETDTAETVTESAPAEEAPAENVPEEAEPSQTVPAEEAPAETVTEETPEEITEETVEETGELLLADAPKVLGTGDAGAQGSNIQWTLYDDGRLIFSGSGAMADYSAYTNRYKPYFPPWSDPFKEESQDFLQIIRSVEFGVGITHIGESALDSSCASSVKIPNTVTSIGDNAFAGTELTSVVLPDSVQSLGSGVFAGCSELTSVKLPAGIRELPNSIFSGTGLTAFEIPNTVVRIGDGAFQSTKLTSVTIPESVQTIGRWAFSNCASLTDVRLPAGTDVQGYAFNGTPWLEKQQTTGDFTVINGTLLRYTGEGGDVVVPSGVKRIATSAFDLFTGKITSLTLPEGLVEIEESAFFFRPELTSVKFPSTLKTIGYVAFEHCYGLESVTLPDGLETIDAFAFYDTGLSELRVPKGVKSLSGAFTDAPVTLDPENPYYTMGAGGAIFTKDGKTLAYYPTRATAEQYAVPEGTERIGDYAFNGAKVKSVTLPGSMKEIGANAFRYATEMQTITLGSALQRIGERAFVNCDALVNLEIPAKTTEIGQFAFGYREGAATSAVSPYGMDGDDEYEPRTITGYDGTAAAKYAEQNDIEFISKGALPGDVTGDGQITSADALQIQRYVVKRSSVLDNAEKKVLDAADVTGDGQITSADALQIQRYVVQRPSVLDGK